MSSDCSSRLRRGFVECWKARSGRTVDLLVFQPLRNIEVGVTVDLVEPDMAVGLKLVEPAVE